MAARNDAQNPHNGADKQSNVRNSNPGGVSNSQHVKSAGAAPYPSPTPNMSITWFSRSAEGSGNATTLTLVTPLALLIGAGSLATALIPAKTSQTVTTTSLPSPLPAKGGVSSIQSTTGSAFNASSTSALAGTFVSSSATIGSNQNTSPLGDWQTWSAVGDALYYIVDSMHCPPDTTIKQYKHRKNETNELHATQGSAPAPFCGQ